MRNIIGAFIFLFSMLVCAQNNDQIVYRDSLNRIGTENNYHTKRVVKDYYLNKTSYQVLVYYKNGNLKSNSFLSGKDGGHPIGEEVNYYENGQKFSILRYENKRAAGVATYWYDNGQIQKVIEYHTSEIPEKNYVTMKDYWDKDGKQTVFDGNGYCKNEGNKVSEEGNYKNGIKEGLWIGKNKANQTIQYSESYEMGAFISGKSFSSNGEEIPYTAVQVQPIVKDGIGAFYKYISENFRVSKEASKKGISGKIFLNFIIDEVGAVTDVIIARGLGYGLDEEAIRVLKNYGKWTPGYQRGIAVKVAYSLPVAIKL
jgi:TonB family protein